MRQPLPALQVLRGVAALAVVVFHAREEVDAVFARTHLPSFAVGAFGVDLFFVISGFVMVYASASLFGTWRSAPAFLAKRVIRIVPLYWVVTGLFALSIADDPSQTMNRHAFERFVATSLVFVPYLVPSNENAWPVYPLGWTLNYEMFFYVCFAAVLALPRTPAVLTLSLSFAALVTAHAVVGLPGGWGYVASPQILEFVAGTLLALLFLAGWRLPGRVATILFVAGTAIVTLATLSEDHWWAWRGIVWGLPAAVIVGAAALRGPVRSEGPLMAWFERLGDASYALYLIHYGLFVAIEAALARAGDVTAHLPTSIFMALLILSAVMAAFVVHRRFEAPLTRALQRRLIGRRLDASPAA